ncbi:MAG: PTS IIA-like nitrogen regulatory protein PtsN [Alphaproteobacteria bacterium]|jgi:PTS system nitrogen regulatory IIA component
MDTADLLTLNAVIPSLRSGSKKQSLQDLSKVAAGVTGVDERQIFEVLLERERLGTTGVGNGIAIPHGKLPGLDRLHGVFARLEKPIEFESIDEQPVDLIFLLLAPEGAGADHLKALARVSRLLRNTHFCDKLRGSDSRDAIFALLTQDLEGAGQPALRAAS